jgi:uncharacterized protein YjbJ (UPF0337 family)
LVVQPLTLTTPVAATGCIGPQFVGAYGTDNRDVALTNDTDRGGMFATEINRMDKDRIAGAAKDLAGKAEGAFGKVTGDAETEISGRAREAAGTAQNAFGQAKDAVRDLGEAASGYAQDALDAGSDYYRDGSRAVAAKIREQPMTSLLAAGAIGFTLGVLLTHQPRRRSNWRDYYR